MKHFNIFLVPAVIFSIFTVVIITVIVSLDSTIAIWVMIPVVLGLCALKFWMMYIVAYIERRNENNKKD